VHIAEKVSDYKAIKHSVGSVARHRDVILICRNGQKQSKLFYHLLSTLPNLLDLQIPRQIVLYSNCTLPVYLYLRPLRIMISEHMHVLVYVT